MRAQWIVLWSLWAARFVRQPTIPVRVSGGLVRGEYSADGSHVRYFAVPYARVTSEHRFKDADPEPRWDGVYEAMNQNVRCLQRMGKTLVLGQEDCLVANIYTPADAQPYSNIPIMVYIHGGGFFEGSNSVFLYGPDYLVAKRVILITINYRFNIQGFLCLHTKEAPGNAGMKDLVLALKWIQKNGRVFGGDPDNVTIFGESAGSSSVSYLVLSPTAKGLFHKAIMQSGSSLSPWASQFRPVYMASLIAKVMGYVSQDPQKLYNFFQSRSDEELIVRRVPRLEGNIVLSEVLYVPCVEKKIDGVEAFLTEAPIELLRKGAYNKVPMLIGSNNEEGYMFANMENDTVLSEIDFRKALPKNLEIPTQEERNKIADDLRKFYMGDKPISRDTELNLSRFHGEVFFSYHIYEETELLSMTSDKPIYSFQFKYSGFRNLAKFACGWPLMFAPGACHADDLFYLFSQMLPSLFESKMIERMTTLWTNFAKYGNPTPETTDLLPVKWPRVTKDSAVSLVIDTELSTAPLFPTESAKYLREVYMKYRRKF